MRITTRWAGAAALAVLLTGGLSTGAVLDAQGPRAGRFGGPGGHGPGMEVMRDLGAGQLDLTDAQREQIRNVLQGHRDEQRQIAQRLRDARKQLDDAVASTAFDEAAIRARSADVGAVQADAAVLRAKVRGEIWSLLTAEQQQKATELRAKRAERRQQRLEQRKQRQQQRQR